MARAYSIEMMLFEEAPFPIMLLALLLLLVPAQLVLNARLRYSRGVSWI